LIKGYFSIYQATKNKKLKFQFKIVYLGIIIGLLGLFVSSASGILLSNVNFELGSMFRALYPLFITIGLSIAALGININPYSVYIISQKVYQLIVFDHKGLTLFDHQFLETSGKQSSLVTGAIYGISSIMTHALGIETKPHSLKFPGRTILFEFEEKVGFALISNRDSEILRDGLEHFAELFLEAYKNQLDHWNGSVEIFEDASTFIEKSFPFLDIKQE
jgi:hypothetical protein